MIFSDYCRELEKPQKEFGGGGRDMSLSLARI